MIWLAELFVLFLVTVFPYIFSRSRFWNNLTAYYLTFKLNDIQLNTVTAILVFHVFCVNLYALGSCINNRFFLLFLY
jgi:hypothetical protein